MYITICCFVKVCSSVVWQDVPTILHVRGKIGPFGCTQNWNVLDASGLPSDIQGPDTTTWSPVIVK
ncbi:MAG: hypothetical protein E7011_03210 [Alphaproteobacteria bacterium]|nr:hypothetical protein [Alphaproteobacteria bacterium]